MDNTPCGCRKPKPPRPQSVLLNRILCCEKRAFHCLCATLDIGEIPSRFTPPFTLEMVQQSGAPPWWTPLEGGVCDKRLPVCVTIPVCCQIRDACGKLFSAISRVSVETSLTPACPLSECWQYQLIIVPCVRLKCCSPQDNSCALEAQLEVLLEIFMTQLTPFQICRQKPECPELPLYPQPKLSPNSPHWQRCPEARGPYGWPKQA